MPGAPDIKADAQRVVEVMKRGGIAVFPGSMGYIVATTSASSIDKIFQTKQRPSTKRHAMGASYTLHKSVHKLTPENEAIVNWFTQEFDLPLAVVGPADLNHPILKDVDEKTLSEATVNGKLAMLVNAGKLSDLIADLLAAEGLPSIGSSANISGTGTKYIVSDIPQDIIDIADIVIDYGLVKWGHSGRSSTMIDFSGKKPEVVRIGIAYDTIKDHLKRYWGIDLPEDPGRKALPSGHLKSLPPLQSLEKLVAAR